MKIKFNKQDGVTAEMAWTGQEENVEVNICLCWANGKFLWPVQKEGKSKQQQSPEEKKSPFALLLWRSPPELCAHIQTWVNSGIHLTSPLPSQTATKQKPIHCPRPTTALLCGQASLFTRRSLCASLCVDSSCFQGMRLCAGPQGGWNDAWWECLLELCFAACVCLSAIVYLSIFLFRESHDQI